MPATIRRLFGNEWTELIVEANTEQVAQSLYTPDEATALLDPQQHESSWLPNGHQTTLADFGAYVGGRLVGFMFVQRRDNGVAVLESLYVQPDHRHFGFARLLIRAGVEAARDAGLPTIEIFAMDREPRAIAFWRRLLGPPNATGSVQMPGGRLTAQGWRLETDSIKVV